MFSYIVTCFVSVNKGSTDILYQQQNISQIFKKYIWNQAKIQGNKIIFKKKIVFDPLSGSLHVREM